MDRAEKLVEAHWKYISGVLETTGIDQEMIDIIGFHYKTSGIHFYNHAIEDIKNGNT